MDKRTLRYLLKTRNSVRYKVVLPKGYSESNRYALFLMLHGMPSNAIVSMRYWKANQLRRLRQCVFAFVQSSQSIGWNRYIWSDAEVGRKDIKKAYRNIVKRYPIDTNKVFIGGMSAGGKMSIDVAINAIIPLRGFYACCPVKPDNFNKELVKRAKTTGIRGEILVGENDNRCLAATEEMAEVFTEVNFRHQYEVIKGLGHQIPDDSTERLKRFLDIILN